MRTSHKRAGESIASPRRIFPRVTSFVVAVAVLSVVKTVTAKNIHWYPIDDDVPDVSVVISDNADDVALSKNEQNDQQLWLTAEHDTVGGTCHHLYSRNTDSEWVDQGSFLARPDTEDHSAVDVHLAMDSSDEAHVVFEARDFTGQPQLYIGYKWSGDATNWDPDAVPFQMSEGTDSTFTPRLFVKGDSLHVTWLAKYGGERWIMHRAREINPGDGAHEGWGPITRVTQAIGEAKSLFVDDSLRVHLLDSKGRSAGADMIDVAVIHVSGTAPEDSGVVWTDIELDTLETYTLDVSSEGLGEGGDDGPQPTDIVGNGDYLHFAWDHREEDPPHERRTAFATLDLGSDTWDPPLAGTSPWPDSLLLNDLVADVTHRRPQVVSDESGVYVFWFDESPQGGGGFGFHAGLHYRHSEDLSPTDLSAWSPTAQVAPTTAISFRVSPLIEDGVLLVTYLSQTQELSQEWNLHFREGHALPDAATMDMDWNGVIALDGDFTIHEDVTVTIAPGTYVEVAASDRLQSGEDTSSVEIIVEDGGKLVAGQDSASTAVFATALTDTLFGPGDEWYGIRLQAMASAQTGYGFLACQSPQTCTPTDFCSDCDEEKSEFKNVLISDANYGLRIEGNVAPELDNVTFEDITDEKDIYLTRDVVIPVDFEWNLIAPTHVVASSTSVVLDYDYGNEDKIDLIVEGLLNTDSIDPGPVPNPVEKRNGVVSGC